MTVVVGLAEDRVQVFETLHHADGHLATVGRLVRAGVQRRPEAFADLLHPRLKLLALKEDDEDRLVDLVAAQKGIFQGVLDLSLAQEDVAATGAPEHPLEGRQALAKDDAGHESELDAAGVMAALFRDELLVLAELTSDIHLILLLEELLGLAQDVLQLSQLQEVLLEGFGVLVDLIIQALKILH